MANKKSGILFVVSTQTRGFVGGMQRAGKAMTGFNQTMTRFVRTWRNIGVYSGTAIVLREIVRLGVEMEKLNVQVTNASRAFATMGTTVNLDTLRDATRGLVGDLTLMQQAIKFENFGLPVQQLGKFLEFAQYRAQTTGESIDYLVNSIVIGLGRESIKVLDNLSLNVGRFQNMVRGGATYTEALATVMEEEMGDAIGTVTSKVDELKVSWENFMAALSQRIGDLPLVEDLQKVLDFFDLGLISPEEQIYDRIKELEALIGELSREGFLQTVTEEDTRRIREANEEIERLYNTLQKIQDQAFEAEVAKYTPINDPGPQGLDFLEEQRIYEMVARQIRELNESLDVERVAGYATAWGWFEEEMRVAAEAFERMNKEIDEFMETMGDLPEEQADVWNIEGYGVAVDEVAQSFGNLAKEIGSAGLALGGLMSLLDGSKKDWKDWLRIIFSLLVTVGALTGTGGLAGAFPALSGLFRGIGGASRGGTVPFNPVFGGGVQSFASAAVDNQRVTVEIEGDKLVAVIDNLNAKRSYT